MELKASGLLCDENGNVCSIEVDNFELEAPVDIFLNFGDLQLSASKFKAERIDFWESPQNTDFTCGNFTLLSDIFQIAKSYQINETSKFWDLWREKSQSNETAVPCGIENGLFIFRPKILKINDESSDFLIDREIKLPSFYKDLNFDSNWIDDFNQYKSWLRFLHGGEASSFWVGRIAQQLPPKFLINFEGGSLELIKALNVKLFFVEEKVWVNLDLGIVLIISGCMYVFASLLLLFRRRQLYLM